MKELNGAMNHHNGRIYAPAKFEVDPRWGPLTWTVRARLNQLFGEF